MNHTLFRFRPVHEEYNTEITIPMLKLETMTENTSKTRSTIVTSTIRMCINRYTVGDPKDSYYQVIHKHKTIYHKQLRLINAKYLCNMELHFLSINITQNNVLPHYLTTNLQLHKVTQDHIWSSRKLGSTDEP